jgi:hypothetical protein
MAAIDTYAVTSSTAKALRGLNKFGMNLADFAALTTNSSFDGFGNGTGYTVTNWISDGVFANLAAVQAVYPICQSGSDTVDWVLLQSAIDFLIYGSLGSSNYGSTKRKLLIPAGLFNINRSLHIGYGSLGTPPVNLNANRYVTITLEGEGRQTDASGNGMTGTTIATNAYTYPGIVVHGYQNVRFSGFSLVNTTGLNWLANNYDFAGPDAWNRSSWRDPAIVDANWVGGAAVNIGIGFDLYTNSTAAAAYPARVLPSYYGGGTSTASTGSTGGTTLEIDDVKVSGFPIGVGRPHGDSNGEFYRINNTDITFCTQGFVVGASQARNCNLTNVNFEVMHTGISSRGGLTGNANLHGTYQNIHFGRIYQLVDHPLADWSGPLTLRDCYAESFVRIGDWSGPLKLDGCYLSFVEQENNHTIPHSHADVARLILDNTQLAGLPNGIALQSAPNGSNAVEIINGSGIRGGGGTSNYAAHADVTRIGYGATYMGGIYMKAGRRFRVLHSNVSITTAGYGNWLNFWPNEGLIMTFLDQEYTYFHSQYPEGDYPSPSGSQEMQGAVQQFPVPKIVQRELSVTVVSRSGFDLTCTRTSLGDIKADVGDVFGFTPTTGDAALRSPTWFLCVSVTTSQMVLRQQNNYVQTVPTDYNVTGYDWVQIGAGTHLVHYICTRIRQTTKLWVGDVTNGSPVISNIRHAFKFGATDDFSASNFNDPKGMVVGDYFLHQEIERANTGGSGLKVPNLVTAIDFTANTITLTENFNITRTNYPLPFYVKRYTA